jgi:glycosyltransferase involved in cell wall biosynthesis
LEFFCLNVCNLWEVFWPFGIGGVERYLLSLTKYVNKTENVDFSLLTGRSKLRSVTKNIPKFEDAGFLKVYRLGPSPADIINGFLFDAFGSLPEFAEKMRFANLCSEAARSNIAKSADLFHVHGMWKYDLVYVNLGVYLSQHFHKPLVVTLHGSYVGDPLLGGMPLEKPEIKNVLCNHADLITTYSQEIFGFLDDMRLGNKTRLIQNFVDTKKFKNPSAKRNGDTVVYVGRLEGPQDPTFIVEAFRQVKARVPNAKLQIVGYGSLYEPIKKLIRDYGLGESVFLMGKQTDVRPFLWKSDIFVATNFAYLSSLEAWSAGLAVVAPDFGVLRETITNEDNGLIVKPQDSNELASALIRLLEDKQLRERLASNGQENVKNYDISVLAPKIFDVYQTVLKKN